MRYHIDTHVHVYHCYEAESFLSRAARNSAMAGSGATLVLCLTESHGFDFFHELKVCASTDTPISGWSASLLQGQPAVLLKQADQSIIIIAGRQVITRQGLEVLALFTDQQYDDGQETQTVIDNINENNGLAVLPWGVGKWLGKRGTIIEGLLNSNKPDTLAIADISGRPSLWPEPGQFGLAQEKGYNCLYGTDSLPLHSDQLRIASAGMVMDLASDPSLAVAELKAKLYSQTSANNFGKRVSAFRFLKDQLMLRINKQSCLTEQA